MSFQCYLSKLLSELQVDDNCSKQPFAARIVEDSRHAPGISKSITNRYFVLDRKTCQVHIILKNSSDEFERKTLFLTPQPSSFPVSISVSPCSNYLLLLTNTSAHVVDLSRLDSVIQSKQSKIVAKLYAAYDVLSGPVRKVSSLIQARWHPIIRGLLILLTTDGHLYFLRCNNTHSSHVVVELEFVVSVLRTHDSSTKFVDKENFDEDCSNCSAKLNLCLAMGAVCSDFDIGSPLFSSEMKVTQNPLFFPVYILCENGDLIMVSASPISCTEPLVRIVRILPSNEDCYTFDFDSLVCLRSSQHTNQPDVLCFGNRAGRIFHGIILHVPTSVLLQSSTISRGKSIPVLYLIDGVDFNLRSISSSSAGYNSALSTAPSDSLEQTSRLVLLSGTLRRPASPSLDVCEYYYLCIHDFGIHCVVLPWVARLPNLCSLALDGTEETITGFFSQLQRQACTVEHLLLTRNPCHGVDDDDSATTNKRTIVGLISSELYPKPSKESTKSNEEHATSLLVFFASEPNAVKIVIPYQFLLLTGSCDSPCTPQDQNKLNHNENLPSVHEGVVASLKLNSKESDFLRISRRALASRNNSHIPVLSTFASEDRFSESEFISFFVKVTNTLRTTRLARLSNLSASVYQFAEHVEAQIAAQTEGIKYLAAERNGLHKKAVGLTGRHSQILERQETLNHRLSELARRIYGIEAGLTDAEISMRSEVQNLRDRMKSGLLGWFENMRLQYEHLLRRLEKLHSSVSNTKTEVASLRGRLSLAHEDDLSANEIQSITGALKAEGSEIDSLIRAVDRLSTLPTVSS